VAVALICLGIGLVLALIAFMQSRKDQSFDGDDVSRARVACVNRRKSTGNLKDARMSHA
jgi:hypothetical protein